MPKSIFNERFSLLSLFCEGIRPTQPNAALLLVRGHGEHGIEDGVDELAWEDAGVGGDARVGECVR